MGKICEWYGISRQAHYQKCQRRTKRTEEEKIIIEKVHSIRQKHARMGTRKLCKELPELLADTEITIGRDRLFDLLGRCDLLVPPLRSTHRTTWAGTWRCDNLLVDARITAPNQAWVSDITYIRVGRNFFYLVLITDVFSRRIMGFDLSDSLAVDGLLRAFDMAIKTVNDPVKGLIFHSDHGVQYTCHAFRKHIKPHGIRSSMGEIGNCYDNALAERINGILKIEYALGDLFVSQQHALIAVQQAVFLYNFERPHLALDFRKPAHVYQQHVCSLN